MTIKTPKTIYLNDYCLPNYQIHHIDLNFHLDTQKTRVIARLNLQHNPLSKNKASALTLLGEQLELIKISLDGKKLKPQEYELTEDSLSVYNPPSVKNFTLEIENFIHPEANTALEGLYLSNKMLCTQCEAEGFRKITYYLDRPDVMAKFTTTIIADKIQYPILLSNGNQIDAGELDNNRHWVKWEDPFAKPCYLFALVAGQLEVIEDHFTTFTGRKIALQIFVEMADKDKCQHAMNSLKAAMAWDEKIYGREYDLDRYMIVAVSHFNMGAMENKGLNIFNTKFVLASPDTATDKDYEGIAAVIAHEYFHNWSGNRVTCRDWFQLSLKEGFTVFRDQEFSADHGSPAVKRIEDVNLLRMHQFAEDAGPLAHPIRPESYIEINNFYTLTIYEKGAEVIRMLHTILGKEKFRAGSDLYFDRHDGQAVTCDDFIQAMEEASSISLQQFKRWYTQVGTPVVNVLETYDSQTQTLTLTLEQHHQAPQPLQIPIKIGLLNAKNGSVEKIQQEASVAVDEMVLSLTQKSQQFIFKNLKAQPVVSLLRSFSAPIKVNFSQTPKTLAFLLSHDTDTFNRWEAGQKLAVHLIFSLVEDIQQDRALQLDSLFLEAFKNILSQQWGDLAYFSLLLTLPAELYLAEQMTPIDVDAIHQAREFIKRQLAEKFQHQFSALYQKHHQDHSAQLDAISMGNRCIKNCCLTYLSQLNTPETQQLMAKQFESARNMTDKIAALGFIINNQHPQQSHYLESFYQQWQHDALVIDKWFALQATSSHTQTFKNVQALLKHDAFDLKNPNRMRSLIGSFSRGNPVRYHAKNGEGYQFLADHVILLNAINPQVASRMLTTLTQWQRFDQSRQKLMKMQLERIVNTKNISKDVYELASKSLA